MPWCSMRDHAVLAVSSGPMLTTSVVMISRNRMFRLLQFLPARNRTAQAPRLFAVILKYIWQRPVWHASLTPAAASANRARCPLAAAEPEIPPEGLDDS